MSETRAYPDQLAVYAASQFTINAVKRHGARDVAEIGVYRGHTTRELAQIIPPGGSLHLFDFEDVVARVADDARNLAPPSVSVVAYPSTHKVKDSYCWQLGRLLRENHHPIWDYVYLDGAHTWDVDGFAVLLAARLLRPGGHIELDDYVWTMASSRALSGFDKTREWYTDEQIQTPAIKMICDVLLRRGGFEEVSRDRLFRRI